MTHHLKSFPFKEGDYQHANKVLHPSFRYDPNNLCPVCLELLTLSVELEKSLNPLTPQYFGTTFTYGDVYNSATLGCHLCSLFHVSMQWGPRDKNKGLAARDVCYQLTPSTETPALFTLGLYLEGESYRNGPADWVWIVPNNSGEAQKWQRLACDSSPVSLGRSTGDRETTALAKSWLEKCLQEHDGCRETDNVTCSVRPARLLDLEGGVKLVDSNEAGDAAYVTLSHCWGEQKYVTRLLQENEALFRQGQIGELPKTFLDAIYVTKELGYRYLWIDSLCIIQNSTQDWEVQAKTMALVYTNSAFTIAALKSSGSREGCFTVERNPLGRRALHLSGLGISAFLTSSGYMWEMEVGRVGHDASPLHSRAWVVQEMHSSPRTLLYGKHGIYWECRCAQASECHYRKLAWDDEYNRKTWLQRLLRFGSEQDSEYSSQSWMNHWKGMFSAYSSSQLTYNTDKIIAITGLISEIERRSNYARRCILGIWDHDMTRMALWSRKDNTTLSSRLKNGMPTWSWASIEGTCTYMMAPGKLEWNADVHIDESSAPGCMVIRSWRREVLQDYKINVLDDLFADTDNDSSIDDYNALALNPEDPRMGEKGWGGNLDVEPYCWWPDCVKPDASTPLHIVQLQRFFIEKETIWVLWCLVLTPKTQGAGEYERVGLTLIRFDDPLDDPFTKDEGLCETIMII